MKRLVLVLISVFLLVCPLISWAGDKEEAELRIQLLQEKFMRIHLTIEVLNNRLTESQNIPATIKALEKQREEIRLELEKLTVGTKPPISPPPKQEVPKK